MILVSGDTRPNQHPDFLPSIRRPTRAEWMGDREIDRAHVAPISPDTTRYATIPLR